MRANVPLQRAHVGECAAASWALLRHKSARVRLLARVSPAVQLEVIAPCKLFSTTLTNEWFVARVRAEVHLHGRRLSEQLVTLRTLHARELVSLGLLLLFFLSKNS